MGARRRSIAQRVAAIRDDRTHGASYLAQQAVRTLALAAEEAEATEVRAVLQGIAEELLHLRPGMAPIKNAVLAFVRHFSQGGATPAHAHAIGEAAVDQLMKAGA